MSRSYIKYPSTGEGFVDVKLGLSTTSAGLRIYDASDTLLHAFYGDGSSSVAVDGTTDTSFGVNTDATAGVDQDSSIVLSGGDGGSEIIKTTLKQDSSADLAYITIGGGAAGTTRKTPTLVLGLPGETTASLDARLRFDGATDAGVTKNASILFEGEEDRLTSTATTNRVSDGTLTLALNAGSLSETGLVNLSLTGSGTVAVSGTTVDIDGSGAVSVESSGGALNVGADAVAQAVNIATGAAARVISIGNAASASATVNAGVGALTLSNSTASLVLTAGALTETALASVDITPSGAITMKSGTAGIYGDDTGWWDFNGSGAVSETGMTTFSLTPSSTVTITGGGAVLVDTLDVTAGGATAGTASVTIESGARTKNDADAGVPTSGAVVVRSGTTAQTTSAATGGASGNASLGSGDTDVTIAAGTGGASGNVSVRSGNTDISAAVAATGGATGAATFGSGNALSTGAGATSGASGAVILSSGTSADANTGSVTVETGAPAATGTSGNLSMRTGNPSGAGTSGNIDISTGATTGGTRGTVSVTGSTISVTNTTGNLTLDNQATTGATNFDTGTNTSATKVAIRSDAGTEHFAVQGDGGTKFSTATGITAFASGGQASATQLAALFNEITTCATAGDSVKLPAAVAGATVTVKNSGVTAADVFPGSSDSINTLAADAAIRLPSGCTMTFHAVDSTVWEVTSRTALDLVSVAAGTSHTGSTDEAVLASRTIQANRLTAGTTCRVAWGARVTADNAGTTLTGRLRLGGTTLTGTELCVTGAVDTSSGHYFSGWFEFVSRATPGAAVAITGIGQTMIGAIGASGAAPVQQALAPTNFATNAALLLEVTGDWSAADANAVQMEYFTVSFPNG